MLAITISVSHQEAYPLLPNVIPLLLTLLLPGPFLTLTISHQITLAAVLPSLLPSLLPAVRLTSHFGTAFTAVLPSLLTLVLHY